MRLVERIVDQEIYTCPRIQGNNFHNRLWSIQLSESPIGFVIDLTLVVSRYHPVFVYDNGSTFTFDFEHGTSWFSYTLPEEMKLNEFTPYTYLKERDQRLLLLNNVLLK